MEFMLPGLISALGILVVLMQFDFRKVLYFSLVIDVVATGGLAWIFSGTYSGMMSGIFGGLFVSMFLAIVKKLIGYKKPTTKGWVQMPPEWRL